MEKRASSRLPINYKIFIYHNHLPVAFCVTRDIGKLGIFAKTGPLVYKLNTELKIQFNIKTPTGSKHIALPARVRYADQFGIGLAFDAQQGKMLDLWQEEFEKLDSQNCARMTDNSGTATLARTMTQ